MSNNDFYTDSPIHPGEHLKDTLASFGLSQTELSNRIGKSRKVINEIISGKAPIAPSTAILLERVLNVPAHVWNNLQRNFDLNIAYLSEQVKIKKESKLLSYFPIRQMIKFGWIPECMSNEEKVKNLLSFFCVSSLMNIENSLSVQFRRSIRDNISKEALYAWIRQGEYEVRKIETSTYDKIGLQKCLSELRNLTNVSPELFQPEVKRICAGVGVAVVFVPELPKTYINGATFWFDGFKKSALLLSLRFKTNDNLWFSFFHELGHIILHRKKENFLDISGLKLTGEDRIKEKEADTFAANILIPDAKWNDFKYSVPYTRQKILQFSQDIAIAPGIVVGRLQKEELLPYSHLNGLKEKYQWVLD